MRHNEIAAKLTQEISNIRKNTRGSDAEVNIKINEAIMTMLEENFVDKIENVSAFTEPKQPIISTENETLLRKSKFKIDKSKK